MRAGHSGRRPLAPAGGTGAGAAAGTPKRGGTAVIVTDGDPTTLNVATTTSNTPSDIGAKIFDGLVWLESRDGAFVPQPSLATSWTVSPDGLTYGFKLRPGVKWHDGRDFTSADVKYTYEEVLAKYHPRSMNALRRLAGIDTPDPLSVTIRLSEPYAPFLILQTVFDSPILPRHLYEGTDVPEQPGQPEAGGHRAVQAGGVESGGQPAPDAQREPTGSRGSPTWTPWSTPSSPSRPTGPPGWRRASWTSWWTSTSPRPTPPAC